MYRLNVHTGVLRPLFNAGVANVFNIRDRWQSLMHLVRLEQTLG